MSRDGDCLASLGVSRTVENRRVQGCTHLASQAHASISSPT